MSRAIKRGVFGLCCTACVLLAIFLSGPKVAIETSLHPVDLPPDLDRYLAVQEKKFDDIVVGAEKKIIWFDEVGVRTPLSIVYIHGFSASRQETAPLSEIVAQELGANLYYTRLTGHGRGGDAMLDGSVNLWLNDANEALKIGQQIGKKVVMIGVSTGGTLAMWLAAQPTTKHVKAFVLISPNCGFADFRTKLLMWPWGGAIAELLVGKERSWEPDNSMHAQFWTHRYPTRALLPMLGLVSLVDSLDLGSIQAPILTIYSPRDQVVSPRAIEQKLATLRSPKRFLLPFRETNDPDQHVLAGDILSPGSTGTLASMITNFLHD